MADLEILTLNKAGDGWIDEVPTNQVSTGYQAQNTNFTARTRGLDSTNILVNADNTITIKAGGVVDVDGVPFKVAQDVTLSDPTGIVDGLPLYIRVVDGSTNNQKTIEYIQGLPHFKSDKNYYENGGRLLNWKINQNGSSSSPSPTLKTVTKLTSPRGSNVYGSMTHSYSQIVVRGGEVLVSHGEDIGYTDQVISIQESGVYELVAIAGGKSDGYGGGSALLHTRLTHADRLYIRAGGKNTNTKISINSPTGSYIEGVTGASGVISVDDVTTPTFVQKTQSGGDPAEDGGSVVANGGGAGKYQGGGDATNFGSVGFDGACAFQLFGLGNTTGGCAIVRWISD